MHALGRAAVSVACTLGVAVAAPVSLGAPAHASVGRKITVRITGTNGGTDERNGGLAGVGRFVASGAIVDRGKCAGYRTVRGSLITLRFVSKGRHGTITFVDRIDTSLGTSRWTITSGTGRYRGLHGRGIERENADFTVSTLSGSVWR